jgi:hypothetical protein
MGNDSPLPAGRLLAEIDASQRLKIHHSAEKVEFSFCPQGSRHLLDKTLGGISCQSWRPAVFRNHTCNPPNVDPQPPLPLSRWSRRPHSGMASFLREHHVVCQYYWRSLFLTSGYAWFLPPRLFAKTSTGRGCAECKHFTCQPRSGREKWGNRLL